MLLYRSKQFLAGSHVASANENGSIHFFFWRSGEDRTFNQRSDIIRGKASVTNDMVRAAIIGNNCIKYGWVRVCIELK